MTPPKLTHGTKKHPKRVNGDFGRPREPGKGKGRAGEPVRGRDDAGTTGDARVNTEFARKRKIRRVARKILSPSEREVLIRKSSRDQRSLADSERRVVDDYYRRLRDVR